MNARCHIVENNFDAEDTVNRLLEPDEFERACAHWTVQAHHKYTRLLRDNSIQTLRQERPMMNDESIAAAILLRTLETSGALGPQTAYRRLKRLSPYEF